MKGRKNLAALFFIAAAFLVLVYITVYAKMVKPLPVGFGVTVPTKPIYTFGENALAPSGLPARIDTWLPTVFAPIHAIDRHVRPQLWADVRLLP